MAWIKPLASKALSNRMTLFGEAATFKGMPMLLYKEGLAASSPDESVDLGIFFDTNMEQNKTHPVDWWHDTWHHVAFTIDNAQVTTQEDVLDEDGAQVLDADGNPTQEAVKTGTNTVKIFLDGQVAHVNADYPNQLGLDELPGFVLGTYTDMSKTVPNMNIANDHFHGHMDDVGIWNKVLTEVSHTHSPLSH